MKATKMRIGIVAIAAALTVGLAAVPARADPSLPAPVRTTTA